MTSTWHPIEDPSINRVAGLSADDMLHEIGRRYAKGDDYFHARECVMADFGPRLAKQYGKETAKRALDYVMSQHPRELPAYVQAARLSRHQETWVDVLEGTFGPGVKYSKWQCRAKDYCGWRDKALEAAFMIGFPGAIPATIAMWAWSDVGLLWAPVYAFGAGACLIIAARIIDGTLLRAAHGPPRIKPNNQPEVIAEYNAVKQRAREQDAWLKRDQEERARQAAEKEATDLRQSADTLNRLARSMEREAKERADVEKDTAAYLAICQKRSDFPGYQEPRLRG